MSPCSYSYYYYGYKVDAELTSDSQCHYEPAQEGNGDVNGFVETLVFQTFDYSIVTWLRHSATLLMLTDIIFLTKIMNKLNTILVAVSVIAF